MVGNKNLLSENFGTEITENIISYAWAEDLFSWSFKENAEYQLLIRYQIHEALLS